MLSKAQITNYLIQLGKELAVRGMQGEILLAGGAVMCLVHEARDSTKDIDALYEPKTVINDIAVQIAEEYNLPRNWLNDSVKGFIDANATIEEYTAFEGLRIQTITAEYLLAMKLVSARYGETDYDDINFLLNKLNITTVEHALDILQLYYPPNRILPKTIYLLEELLLGTDA